MKAIYKCDYCSVMSTKDFIKAHEDLCDFNPKNKTCATCKYYECTQGAFEHRSCKLNAFEEQSNLCGVFDNTFPKVRCDKYEQGTPHIVKVRGL